jgi:predicted PurR-regulated permease PerM
VLLAACTVALLAILAPFYGALLWAVIISLLFTPLHRRLLLRWPGRHTLAASLTLLTVLLTVVLPFAFLSAALINEVSVAYTWLQSPELNPAAYFRAMFEALPPWAAEMLRRQDLADFDALQGRLAELFSQAGRFVAMRAVAIGQNTFGLLTALAIMLYLSFFFIRDGDRLRAALRAALPLSLQHQRSLADKFSTVLRATVKGNVVVAVVQGALGGLAFWVLGVQGTLLWAVLMAFLSLLPAVGAALVWGPVALYLLSTGATLQALGLIAWGLVVVGLVDNLLRPMLVGKDTRLPDYVVLITTLGGMAVFGINGFVLGPLIAAMFVAVWQIAVVDRGA